MKEGVRDLCAFLSTAALAMAVLSSLGAVTTGNRGMFIQTDLFGLIGACTALAMALRL